MKPGAFRGAGAGLLVAAALLLAAGSQAADGPGPRAVIETLEEAYLGVMKQAEALGYAGRFAKLEPALERAFDFAAMARLSIGGRWKDLSPEQQKKFVETFQRLSVATYASRFTGYSGEKFEVVGEEPSTQGTVLVRTRVVIPDKDPVQLDYRLRSGAAGWRVIDVFLDGTVSELALRRSEYSGLLDRSGFDGLIGALDARIAEMAAKPAPPAGR